MRGVVQGFACLTEALCNWSRERTEIQLPRPLKLSSQASLAPFYCFKTVDTAISHGVHSIIGSV
jgi:hypothetical protein